MQAGRGRPRGGRPERGGVELRDEDRLSGDHVERVAKRLTDAEWQFRDQGKKRGVWAKPFENDTVAAMACDITRISTILWSGGTSGQRFPSLGFTEGTQVRIGRAILALQVLAGQRPQLALSAPAAVATAAQEPAVQPLDLPEIARVLATATLDNRAAGVLMQRESRNLSPDAAAQIRNHPFGTSRPLGNGPFRFVSRATVCNGGWCCSGDRWAIRCRRGCRTRPSRCVGSTSSTSRSTCRRVRARSRWSCGPAAAACSALSASALTCWVMSCISAWRLSLPIASATSLPVFTCGSATWMGRNMASTWPPSRSVTACAVPRYGLCVRYTPAACLNSSIDMWCGVPTPTATRTPTPINVGVPKTSQEMFGDALGYFESVQIRGNGKPGLDPEINESGGGANFTQGEFNTQPPLRYYTVRFNFTF